MAEGAPTTLGSLLVECRSALVTARVADPGLDARLLVEFFTDTTRTQTLTDPDRIVEADVVATVRAAVARRIAREPVHRIIGFRSFYGLDLRLSPATLEPRPDTETLIDAVLPAVRGIVARKGKCRVLDLGTGTGAIALALLANVPQATATGVDISDEALATARQNAAAHRLEARFSTLRSDWFGSVEGRWDVIVSNPPYIRSATISDLSPDVRGHDPLLALDGGGDGLDAYRQIAAGAPAFLAEDGDIDVEVGVEIGFDQRQVVSDLFIRSGFLLHQTCVDLGGNDRVLIFRQA